MLLWPKVSFFFWMDAIAQTGKWGQGNLPKPVVKSSSFIQNCSSIFQLFDLPLYFIILRKKEVQLSYVVSLPIFHCQTVI